MTTRLAINGFGRIGRCALRRIFDFADPNVELVAVNDLGPKATLVHLLKYDSVHGPLGRDVKITDNGFSVDSHEIRYISERNVAQLPWGELGVDIVIESTGLFTERDKAAIHLDAGAHNVIVSAPGKNADYTVVLGVNSDGLDSAQHRVVSNASCTTNCLAPVAKVLHEQFGGIQSGFMTTCHAYTGDQRLLDAPHKDLRRARAAATSVIPTSTGAAKAIGLVLPELAGKLDGMALRVPVPCGSVTDLVAVVGRETNADEVNAALRAAADGPLRGFLEYTDDPIVSADIVGNPSSSIVDASMTMAHGTMVKVLAWYDNEWGYSSRTAQLAGLMAAQLANDAVSAAG